jgi:hypothetical protein
MSHQTRLWVRYVSMEKFSACSLHGGMEVQGSKLCACLVRVRAHRSLVIDMATNCEHL